MAQFTRSHLVNCGGVNNSASDELIADNELADARNLIPDYTGTANLIKRPGLVANSAPAGTYAANTALWSRVTAYAGKFAKYFAESTTKSDVTYTFNIYAIAYDAEGDATASVLNSDATWGGNLSAWCTFAGYDLYVDYGHALKTSDGSSFTAISNIPANTVSICPYNNYLFALINDSTSLRWSDQEDPETWDAAHELVFALNGAYDGLVSLREHGSELAVFSKRRIMFVQGYGPLDFTVTHTIDGIGGADHNLTCSTPVGLFWWSILHGLCWTADNRTVDFPMLRKLRNTFYVTSSLTTANGFMFWCPDRLCVSTIALSGSGGGYTWYRIDYYPLTDAFFLGTYTTSTNTFKPAAVAVDDLNYATYSRPVYYFVQRDQTATTGKAYVRRESETVSTDVGDSVTAYLKTKRFWGTGNPTVEAILNDVVLTTYLTTGGTISYSYYLDSAMSAFARTVDLTVGTSLQDKRIGINARYRKIQHYLSDSLSERTRYIALHELGDAAGRVTK